MLPFHTQPVELNGCYESRRGIEAALTHGWSASLHLVPSSNYYNGPYRRAWCDSSAQYTRIGGAVQTPEGQEGEEVHWFLWNCRNGEDKRQGANKLKPVYHVQDPIKSPMRCVAFLEGDWIVGDLSPCAPTSRFVLQQCRLFWNSRELN